MHACALQRGEFRLCKPEQEDYEMKMNPMAEKVIIGECWARDGLQSEKRFVPTAAKIEMIRRMVEAGLKASRAVLAEVGSLVGAH